MLDLDADDVTHEEMKFLVAHQVRGDYVTVVLGHVLLQLFDPVAIEIDGMSAPEKKSC